MRHHQPLPPHQQSSFLVQLESTHFLHMNTHVYLMLAIIVSAKLSSGESHWHRLGNYTRELIHPKVFMTGHFKWPLAALLLIHFLHALILPPSRSSLGDEFVIMLLPFSTLNISFPHKMCISEWNVHYGTGRTSLENIENCFLVSWCLCPHSSM